MGIIAKSLATVVVSFAAAAAALSPAAAQQTNSHLYEVTKAGKLRVCQYPLYYSISFRNPATGEIEGIDADLAKELAKELGTELEIVESSFGTFIADLQANKCDIGMFGIGAKFVREGIRGRREAPPPPPEPLPAAEE